MPADFQSTARALSLPVSPPLAPVRTSLPGWIRSRSDSDVRPRRSSPGQRAQSLWRQCIRYAVIAWGEMNRLLMRLNIWQKLALAVLSLAALIGGILFLMFNERIFTWLEPFAERWRALPAGWLIVWGMIFVSAFPPIIGYSTCLTIAGFLYGFPNGWFVAASATIVGSLCSFLFSRTLLSGYSNRLVEADQRFAALALTLKHDGLWLLVMIRLCPLPYSLSNCAMAAFPTVQPLMYALATAIITPKLLIHVFIGGRLAALAKNGGKMDAATKALNYLSIAGGAILGVVVAWSIYQRTMARARQLEAEGRGLGRETDDPNEHPGDFHDDLEDNRPIADDFHDDISLFETQANDGAYRDESSQDENNIFSDGDGDEDGQRGLPR